MNFFSKLGKKASKTYQVTKEKAVSFSEELKFKTKINDLKDEIEEFYKKIGKIVYEEIKDGKDVSRDDVIEVCESISRRKDEIERLQADILALKNVSKCINCGVELDIGDPFCYKCGTKQPETEKVEIKNETEDVVKNAETVEITEAIVDTLNNDNSEDTENNNNNNN